MTTDQETLRTVGEWLEEGRTTLPDHVLAAVLEQLPTRRQRRPWRPAWSIAGMVRSGGQVIATAALVVAAMVGFQLLQAAGPSGPAGPGGVPSAVVSPTPSSTVPPSSLPSLPAAPASLPALRLPGTRASPAGEYGWEGGPGDQAGMHKVTDGRETTELQFVVGPDCLATGDGQAPVPVRLGGLEGVVVEAFEPPVTFGSPVGDETTRAFALTVGDRTLCAFLTWHATTPADELAAAEASLETLRAVPTGTSRVRITFTLDEGWDTG